MYVHVAINPSQQPVRNYWGPPLYAYRYNVHVAYIAFEYIVT